MVNTKVGVASKIRARFARVLYITTPLSKILDPPLVLSHFCRFSILKEKIGLYFESIVTSVLYTCMHVINTERLYSLLCVCIVHYCYMHTCSGNDCSHSCRSTCTVVVWLTETLNLRIFYWMDMVGAPTVLYGT